MATYDDYVYRLYSEAPYPVDVVVLPKDVFWENELSWSPAAQTVEWSTTGALLVQEGTKLKGREILLQAKDNMAWITREQGQTLQTMRNRINYIMTLSFRHKYDATELFNHKVRFLQPDGLVLAPILDFDQYEPGAYYILKSIKLIEVA